MNFNPHCMWENFNTQTHPSLQTVDGWFCQNRFLLLLHILFKFLAWKYIDRSHLWSFLSWIFNSGWRTSQRDEINALPFKNKNEDFFFPLLNVRVNIEGLAFPEKKITLVRHVSEIDSKVILSQVLLFPLPTQYSYL